MNSQAGKCQKKRQNMVQIDFSLPETDGGSLNVRHFEQYGQIKETDSSEESVTIGQVG